MRNFLINLYEVIKILLFPFLWAWSVFILVGVDKFFLIIFIGFFQLLIFGGPFLNWLGKILNKKEK